MTAPVLTDPAGKLLLLDTPSLYFRAFFGIPDSMTAPDGTPVNAVRGLLDFIARLTNDRKPTRLIAAMDADWRPAFRVDAIPSYKAHRVASGHEEEVPDALSPQVAIIEDVLEALGVACFGVDGLRGRRRHRHAGHSRPGSGRHRHGRPRLVPAGRRLARRCRSSTSPAV